MPSQVLTSVENNFTKGLITESTGLNFPENAATDTDNCEYTLIGDVTRRKGIDLEINNGTLSVSTLGISCNTYKWNNVGGDGLTQLVVSQIGSRLYFWSVTAATTTSPLSQNLLVSTVDISAFTVSTFDSTAECQFADGNGYLFVYHPSCDPVYCTYTAGTITGNSIVIKVRDFVGIPEIGIADNTRPSSLTNDHSYNLQNQGWTVGNPWSATSASTVTIGTGSKVFTIATGLTISAGQAVTVNSTQKGWIDPSESMTGTVTSYTGSTLTLSISSFTGTVQTINSWSITPYSTGYINTWNTAVGNFPSNADQWWTFKNTSGVFDPATTQANTSVGTGSAPKGHIVFNTFQQYRTSLSGVAGLTDISTTVRPTNGTWFQGRVWYTGVNASFAATGDAPFTTWTESIYFSQVVTDITDFGKCYQQNDPTSQILFDLLPTDGGVIIIQGSGTVYRLFPTQNGLLVFAANGVWFITGSRGIGFSANDYTITKISSVQSISCTSYVDVLGLPLFWNEEGIYQVQANQTGSLSVNSITVGTIQSFYDSIPMQSKKFVRGAYHPINYTIQWIYRSTNESGINNRYNFDKILNYNTYNKAFFPFTVNATSVSINGINYIAGPGGSTTTSPGFKYFSSVFNTLVSFADEHDTTYIDWATALPVNYVSYFVTGYKLHGQAQRRFQMPYIYIFNRILGNSISYSIQGLWDYATDRNSNRWSVPQFVLMTKTHFGNVFRRHRIRGQGLVLQIKVYSTDGQPFDIMGWSVLESQNTGV